MAEPEKSKKSSSQTLLKPFAIVAGLAGAGLVAYNVLVEPDRTQEYLQDMAVNNNQTEFTQDQLESVLQSLQYTRWVRAANAESEEKYDYTFRHLGYRPNTDMGIDKKFYMMEFSSVQLDKIANAANALLEKPPQDFIDELWEHRSARLVCIEENFLGHCSAAAISLSSTTWNQQQEFADRILPGLEAYDIPNPMSYRDYIRSTDKNCQIWNANFLVAMDVMTFDCDEETGKITQIRSESEIRGVEQVIDITTGTIVAYADDEQSDDTAIVSVTYTSEHHDDVISTAREKADLINERLVEQRQKQNTATAEYFESIEAGLDELIALEP